MLSKPIIPVVLGSGPYDYFVPKSGYIDVFDFKTPKTLAMYLKYLSKNSTAYNAYFQWKKHVVFDSETNFPHPFAPICSMCIHLQLEEHFGITRKTIQNIGSYWTKNNNNCKTPYMSTNVTVYGVESYE